MKAMCEADSGCLPEGCVPDGAGRIGCGYFRLNIYQYKVSIWRSSAHRKLDSWCTCSNAISRANSCTSPRKTRGSAAPRTTRVRRCVCRQVYCTSPFSALIHPWQTGIAHDGCPFPPRRTPAPTMLPLFSPSDAPKIALSIGNDCPTPISCLAAASRWTARFLALAQNRNRFALFAHMNKWRDFIWVDWRTLTVLFAAIEQSLQAKVLWKRRLRDNGTD